MARLKKTRFPSSPIAAITYDPDDGFLEVTFRKNGHIYNYFDVPLAIYDALMAADSKPEYLSAVIAANFEYARVEIPMG